MLTLGPVSGSRIALGVTIGAVGVAAATLWHGLRPVSDTDLWWHMRLGELMLDTRSLVDTDPFSFTAAGAPWPYKDAGSAILLLGVWRLGGAAGLVVFKALLLAGTAALLWWWLARQRKVPPTLALLATALAIEGTAFRFTERAASMSLTLLVAALVIIERDRRVGRGLWWLVPLTILNANLHRAAIVLPVVASAYAGTAWGQPRLGLPEGLACPDRRRATLVAIGTALACLVTPFGWALVTTTVGLMQQHSELVTEWAPLSMELVARLTPATFVVAFVVVGGGVLELAKRRPIDLWNAALLAMAFGLGLGSLRHLPYLGLLGVAPATAGLAYLEKAWTGRLAPLIASATGITALAAAMSSPLANPSLGLTPAHFPEVGVAWVQARPEGSRIRGHVFNEFGFGGFLIFHLWPEQRVYSDGRTDLVYTPEHVERYVRALSDPRTFAEEAARWDLQWVFLDNFPGDGRRAHFDANPAWTLVHVSRRAVIYVRTDGVNADLAAREGYRVLWAHDLPGSVTAAAQRGHVDEAIVELQRMLDDDPDNPYAADVLSRVLEIERTRAR